ncbi:MAG: hypothetical protein ACXV5U_08965 [Ilumatobacteraceae bacterium]
MSDAEAGSDNSPISPWDRRVVRSLEVSESAARGVVALRVIAAVVAAATVVGNFLYVFADDNGGASFGFSNLTQRFRLGQFFASVATPLAFAGLVFGLSYLVEINSARLDLDIVLDDAEEIERADPEVPTD